MDLGEIPARAAPDDSSQDCVSISEERYTTFNIFQWYRSQIYN